MQYRYLGDVKLSGVHKKIAEQLEFWALNGLRALARVDLEEAARAFGSSVDVFLSRLKKYDLFEKCFDKQKDKG